MQNAAAGILTHGGPEMNKDLSQEERGTLASEFTYQGKKSGMIGGYCEADFPLYYAIEELA